MKVIGSIFLALFLVACSQEQRESDTINGKVVEQENKIEQVKELKEKKVEPVASVEEKEEGVEKVAAKTSEVEEVKEEVEKVSKEVAAEVKEVTAKQVEPVVAKAESSVDGAAIYMACQACHGAKAEKKALNKSQVIQGWQSSKIVAALNGYKDGTYGGSMKGVMKPQATKLSDTEIDAVSKYISGL